MNSFYFVGLIGGAEAVITDGSVSDLGRLCGEFEFTAFGRKVEGGQSTQTRGENFVCRRLSSGQGASERQSAEVAK
jgi:hypothetical protein